MQQNTPFAFPGALGDLVEGRIEAVDVVADVTLVTQNQTPLVMRLTAALAHSALQTAPAFLQNDA